MGDNPMEIDDHAVDGSHPRSIEHARQYLESDGTAVDHPFAESLILLYVTARRSGAVRRVPLVAQREGDDWLIVASNVGLPNNPAWYASLVAHPEVWVRDGAELHEATAATLGAEARAAVWPTLADRFPYLATYAARTDRILPVVRLTRKA